MSDRMYGLLNQTNGEGPSAEFVKRLEADLLERQEAATGTTKIDVRQDPQDPRDQECDEVLLVTGDGDFGGGPRTSVAQWVVWLSFAAASIALLIFVLPLLQQMDSEVDTVDTAAQLEADSLSTIALLDGEAFLQAGTYRTDAVGTQLTFGVEGLTRLPVNVPGLVVFSELDSLGHTDRTLTVRRLRSLPAAADLTADFANLPRPTIDVQRWAGSIPSELLISAPEQVAIGGQPAVRLRLRLADDECEVSTNCAPPFGFAVGIDSPLFVAGNEYLVWVVDQGEEDHLVISASIRDVEDEGWFEASADLIARFDLGFAEPNPVRTVGSGVTRFEALGGIEAVFEDDAAAIFESKYGASQVSPSAVDARIQLLTAPSQVNGSPIGDTEEWLAVLDDLAVEVFEGDGIVVDGLVARSFDVDGGPNPTPALVMSQVGASVPGAGWLPPNPGIVWAIEHPERGFLLISARLGGATSQRESVRAWTTDLLETVEFAESDR